MKNYITILLIIFTIFTGKSQCTIFDPCGSMDITATTAYLGEFGELRLTIDDAKTMTKLQTP